MKYLILIMLMFGILSCEKKEEGFVVKGEIKGIQDSTWLYLQDPQTSLYTDSAQIINEKFELRGSVETPKGAFIFVSYKRAYFHLWLENKEMSIIGDKDDFYNAKITGSKLNDYAYGKKQLCKPFSVRRDSLMSLFFKTQDMEIKKELIPQMNKINEDESEAEINYMKKADLNYASLSDWQRKMDKISRTTLQEVYDRMDENLRMTDDGKALKYFIDIKKVRTIGDQYFDFICKDSSNKEVKLSEKLGKYTLIDFHQFGCGGCEQTYPELDTLLQKYQEKGLSVVSVALTTSFDAWRDELSKRDYAWTQLVETKGFKSNEAIQYNVNGTPCEIIIDENGKIVYMDDISKVSTQTFIDSVFAQKVDKN